MGPSREACDRCHAMKTRCVRPPRSQVCVRCTRLGFTCHYSPPGRTGRPAGSKQKNASHRSKPSPRKSSYQNPPWQSLTSQQTVPGRISPALTAQDSSNAQPPMHFAELELFGSESSFGDGAHSMFFTDDLFQDVMNSNGSRIAATPPSTVSPEPLEQQLFLDSACSSRHDSVASVDEAEYVLLDIQGRLLNLVRVLSSCSSFPQDVEEMYHITDTFVAVVDDIANRLDAPSARSPAGGRSVTHMLLSSCYMSLVQAFGCLVGLLRREPGPKADHGFGPALGISPAQAQMPIPTTANNAPCISVSNVRLAMPHRAVAEINLHLVGQVVQHLQASISRCAAKGQPSTDKSQSMQGLASSSSVSAFTMMAMHELEQRESTLFSGLHMPTLQ